MPQMNMVQAINDGLRHEMKRDDRVVVLGEDAGKVGGAVRVTQGLRDQAPVMFFEPKRIYRAAKGDVPEGDYMVPLGKAAVVREGEHVTIIVWGAMLYEAIAAADEAKAQGIDCEIIDLRTLWPLDIE